MATSIAHGVSGGRGACLGEIRLRPYECNNRGGGGKVVLRSRYCFCRKVQNASKVRKRGMTAPGSEREDRGRDGGRREHVVLVGGACRIAKVVPLAVGRIGARSAGVATWRESDRYYVTHVGGNPGARWRRVERKTHHLGRCCGIGSARGVGNFGEDRGERDRVVALLARGHSAAEHHQDWLSSNSVGESRFRPSLHRGQAAKTNRLDRLCVRASSSDDQASGTGSTVTSTMLSAEGEEEAKADTRSTFDSDESRSAVDLMVDGVSFGQLCDDFVCVSSPAVEATARQLARDIADLREESRQTLIFALRVKYKDPLRSFEGREKYGRMKYFSVALDNPSVVLEQMEMLSTATLMIKWTARGVPKLPLASLVGREVVLRVKSTFQLNQITGQVTDHDEEWDLTGSSLPSMAYFYATRLAFSSVEAGNDLSMSTSSAWKNITKPPESQDPVYYRDPNDPRKFFHMDDTSMTDLYQLGFAIALLYLLVQFLRIVL